MVSKTGRSSLRLLSKRAAGYSLNLVAHRLGWTRLPYNPHLIYVEPTSACNLTCVTCPRGVQEGFRSSEYLSMRHFELVNRQLLELQPRAVILHFAGEPLLHPELPRMVALARQCGAAVALSSNGMLLTPSLATDLIEARLDRLMVNFYPSAEELESQRPGTSWDKLRDNLLTLIEARQRAAVAWPRLRVQVMHTRGRARESIDSEEAVRALLPLLPTDDVVEFTTHRYTGAFAAARIEDPRFGLDRVHGYRPCVHAWSQLGILSDGRVVPCSRDLEAVEVLGHIDEQPLRAIWNGPRYRRLRRALADARHDELELCRHCTALFNGDSPVSRLATRAQDRVKEAAARRWTSTGVPKR